MARCRPINLLRKSAAHRDCRGLRFFCVGPFLLQPPADGLLFSADEICVDAGLRDEVLMPALRRDLTILHHNDVVCPP